MKVPPQIKKCKSMISILIIGIFGGKFIVWKDCFVKFYKRSFENIKMGVFFMDKQLIVTIGREFGSGGHDIAESLAAELGIQLYDKEIIDEAAKRFHFDENVLAYYDEKPVNSVLFPLSLDSLPYGLDDSVEKRTAIAEFSVIREKSEHESFVIVGRCAEHILKDKDILSVFISAEEKDKIARICRKFRLNESDAAALIKRSNNVRRHYHDYYCDDPWGSSNTYDICLNSSMFGVEGCVSLIKACIEAKEKHLQ